MASKWQITNTWKCMTCEEKPEFPDTKELIEHMLDVHSIDTKITKGSKSGVSFLDGQGFYANTFEWELGGITLIQSVVGKKVKVTKGEITP